MYEQSVVALGFDESYGVPGPAQVTWWPSPMLHTTSTGVAVAVADTGPAAAVAVCWCHAAGLSHSHVLTLTSCSLVAGGAISIDGEPSGSCETACWARAAGLTCAAAAWAFVTQIGGIGSITPGPAQIGNTH